MKRKHPIIELTKIIKNYKLGDITVPVLKEVSFTVYEDDFLAITGPSGSGKSTLMHIIGLLDTPTKGKYLLNGSNVTGLSEDALSLFRNKEIGFVFQSFNLLPRSTALENVILPSIYAGAQVAEREKRATSLLASLGLREKMYNKPNQLSGGQQQRVAIARALMNNPKIILADEPTGNLDTKSGEDVMRILRELNNQQKTIIMITHESNIAKHAKKIVHIRDGRIVGD